MSTLLWNHFNLNPETFRALRLTPNHSPVWVNPTVLTKSDPRGHSGLEEKKSKFFFSGERTGHFVIEGHSSSHLPIMLHLSGL